MRQTALVGGHLHGHRHGEAERLRGFEVDEVLKLRRLLNRKIGWFLPPENTIEQGSDLPDLRRNVEVVGNQAACLSAAAPASVNGGDAISCRQIDFQLEIVVRESVGVEDHTTIGTEVRQDWLDIRRLVHWVYVSLYAYLLAGRLSRLVIEM